MWIFVGPTIVLELTNQTESSNKLSLTEFGWNNIKITDALRRNIPRDKYL